jgi:hypothetical protein
MVRVPRSVFVAHDVLTATAGTLTKVKYSPMCEGYNSLCNAASSQLIVHADASRI